MALEKTGLNLGKEIIAWTRTSGKSLIATRPVKINLSDLKLEQPIKTDIVQLSTNIGKHKVPRYLYHLTTESNYEKIIKSGVLKLGSDPDGSEKLIDSGVFLFDLKNLIKHWKNLVNLPMTKQVDQRGSLLVNISNQMYNQANGSGQKAIDSLVLLRISTDKLKQDSLFVRSLTDFHNQITIPSNNNKSSKFLSDIMTTDGEINKDKINHLKNDLNYIYKNLFGNEPANLGKLRTQRKECIEYISKEEIPLSAVSKVGSCEPIESICLFDPSIIKQRWEDLLINSSEINMMKLWN